MNLRSKGGLIQTTQAEKRQGYVWVDGGLFWGITNHRKYFYAEYGSLICHMSRIDVRSFMWTVKLCIREGSWYH